jgi:glutamate dehydrogenase/leucine dehydrogenase
MSDAIELEYWKKGILIVPDFVANAGGVISSYAEYKGYSPKKMFTIVKDKITTATREVLKKALKTGIDPRTVALHIARGRVDAAMKRGR